MRVCLVNCYNPAVEKLMLSPREGVIFAASFLSAALFAHNTKPEVDNVLHCRQKRTDVRRRQVQKIR